jgi:hypothetical protein
MNPPSRACKRRFGDQRGVQQVAQVVMPGAGPRASGARPRAARASSRARRSRRPAPARRGARPDRAGRPGRAPAATARVRCRALARAARISSLTRMSETKWATASCRARWSGGSVAGPDRRRSSSRAPPAVTVRSMAPTAGSPAAARQAARQFEVAPRGASICITARRATRRAAQERQLRPFCVISR